MKGSLVFPATVTAIPDYSLYDYPYAFYGCSNLRGNLTIPYKVSFIGSCAFYGCSNFGPKIAFYDDSDDNHR